MIKAAIICVPIVLVGAAGAITAYREYDGVGALSVGPVRPAYHCEPACPGRDPLLLETRPVENLGVVHHGMPAPVPEPRTGLIFVTACLALARLRRGPVATRRGAGNRRRFLPSLARRASRRVGHLLRRKR